MKLYHLHCLHCDATFTASLEDETQYEIQRCICCGEEIDLDEGYVEEDEELEE